MKNTFIMGIVSIAILSLTGCGKETKQTETTPAAKAYNTNATAAKCTADGKCGTGKCGTTKPTP